MADLPFDRKTFLMREKPLSPDWNDALAQIDRTLRDVMMFLLGGRTSDASSARLPYSCFTGDSFRVGPSSIPGMSIVVNNGIGFQYNPSDLPTNIGAPNLESVSDLSPFKPLYLDQPLTFTVPTAPGAPNSRIDIIEVAATRQLADADTRLQLNPVSRTFAPFSVFKTLTFDLDGVTGVVAAGGGNSTAGISYKIGTAANPGVAPTTTPGYIKIGEINVNNGTVTITGSQIVDRRLLAAPGGVVRASARFQVIWNAGAPTITMLSNNTPPGVDLCVFPSTANPSWADVFCIGGGFTKATFRCTLEEDASLTGTSYNISRHRVSVAAGNQFVDTVNSTIQTAMAASVPPIAVGIGQQRVRVEIDSIFSDGAGNVSQAAGGTLDNKIYSVTVDLSYH